MIEMITTGKLRPVTVVERCKRNAARRCSVSEGVMMNESNHHRQAPYHTWTRHSLHTREHSDAYAHCIHVHKDTRMTICPLSMHIFPNTGGGIRVYRHTHLFSHISSHMFVSMHTYLQKYCTHNLIHITSHNLHTHMHIHLLNDVYTCLYP